MPPTLAPESNANPSSKSATMDAGVPGINPPELKEGTLKATRRAISNADQAYRLCGQIFNPSTERNYHNGVIAEKYNDAPPFDQKKLEQQGELWRHNFSTGFMSTFVNRVVPVPVSMIANAQYLTNARLDDDEDPGGRWSMMFQKGITRLCRAWSGWKTFVNGLMQEDVLYGYAIAVRLFKGDWRPKFFRQDEFGVQDGCGQHANDIQFLAVKQSFLIHELVELIKDRERASKRWNIEATVKAINNAFPRRNTDRQDANNPRSFTDLVREGNLGTSYDAEASAIDCYHLWAREADGKVSHYLLQRSTEGGPETGQRQILFEHLDERESFEQFVAMFTLEPGNGKFYGSRGVGKQIVNLHMAAERARCRMCDQHYLASCIVLQGERGVPTVQFKTRHPFIVFGSDAKIQTEAIPTNVEAFLQLDERLTAYAEQIIGEYMPEKLGEGAKSMTAKEAMIRLQQQQSRKAAYIQRIFEQFGDLMTMVTLGVCDRRTKDKEAREFQARMRKAGMPDEVFDKLARMPAAEVIQGMATQNEAIAALCAELMGFPFINKINATRRIIMSKGGPMADDLLRDLMLPQQIDPSIAAENFRQQLIENEAIAQGAPGIPVSKRDEHIIHLKVLKDEIDRAEKDLQSQPGSPPPKILDNLGVAAVHGKAHADEMFMAAKSAKNKQLMQTAKQYRKFFHDVDQRLMKTAKTMLKQKRQGPPGLPPQRLAAGGVVGPQPPGANGNGSKPPVDEHMTHLFSQMYRYAPEGIKRQIESRLGFAPSFGQGGVEDTHPHLVPKPQVPGATPALTNPPTAVSTTPPANGQQSQSPAEVSRAEE